MKPLIAFTLALTLSSCATYSDKIVNAQGKVVGTCNASGFGLISSIMAKSKFDECMSRSNVSN